MHPPPCLGALAEGRRTAADRQHPPPAAQLLHRQPAGSERQPLSLLPWWQRQDRQPASPDGRERQVLPSPHSRPDQIRPGRGWSGSEAGGPNRARDSADLLSIGFLSSAPRCCDGGEQNFEKSIRAPPSGPNRGSHTYPVLMVLPPEEERLNAAF